MNLSIWLIFNEDLQVALTMTYLVGISILMGENFRPRSELSIFVKFCHDAPVGFVLHLHWTAVDNEHIVT